MGRSNRRQQRPSTPRAGAQPGRPAPPVKPQWRETLDSWGGFPVAGALVAMVLAVGVLIYMNRPGSSVGTAVYTPIARPQVSGRLMGDPNAPVKLIEFADFQCPFCQRFAHDVEPQVFDEFVKNGTASFQYVSFAFLGEESRRAAEAAECAADQGRFWDYHDLLFLRQGKENSGVFSASNLKAFAAELKTHFPDFDTGKFNQCLDSGAKRAAIEQQTKQAADAGVQSTPSFVINGAALSGVQPIEVFRQAVQAAKTGAGR